MSKHTLYDDDDKYDDNDDETDKPHHTYTPADHRAGLEYTHKRAYHIKPHPNPSESTMSTSPSNGSLTDS